MGFLGQLAQDDDEQLKPRIAKPNFGQPALALRGITPPSDNTAEMEAGADRLRADNARALGKTSIEPSPIQQQTDKDRTELNRLITSGSGISQIKNPWARRGLRGLNVAGEVASSFLPQVGTALRALPGTEEHHNQLVNRQQGRLNEDVGLGAKEVQTAESEARVPLTEAQAREANANAAAKENPPEKEGITPEEQTLHDLMTGENGGPRLNAATGKPYTYLEAYEATKKAGTITKPEKPDSPEQQFIDKETAAGKTLAEAIADYAKVSQRPERAGAEDARGERSYQATLNRVEKLRAPIEQRLERISRLEDTLNQNSPQADSLIAPELLTVMAGGQGSGLRMNEAEISRIVGGANNWQRIKAQLMAWQADPSKPFAFQPEQRQEIRNLFTVIKDRVAKKAEAIEEESQNLANSNDPREHRQIYQRLQSKLLGIDSGAGGGQGGGELPPGVPSGATHVYRDPKTQQVVGYALDGQYHALQGGR